MGHTGAAAIHAHRADFSRSTQRKRPPSARVATATAAPRPPPAAPGPPESRHQRRPPATTTVAAAAVATVVVVWWLLRGPVRHHSLAAQTAISLWALAVTVRPQSHASEVPSGTRGFRLGLSGHHSAAAVEPSCWSGFPKPPRCRILTIIDELPIPPEHMDESRNNDAEAAGQGKRLNIMPSIP